MEGLFVEFRDLPLPAPRLERLAATERQVLYYGMRLPHSRGDARPRHTWARDGLEWLSIPPRTAPPEIVEKLPDFVLAAAVDEASCGLFWREDGDENRVRELAAILGQWRQQIVES